jgi:hypothetical protein
MKTTTMTMNEESPQEKDLFAKDSGPTTRFVKAVGYRGGNEQC